MDFFKKLYYKCRSRQIKRKLAEVGKDTYIHGSVNGFFQNVYIGKMCVIGENNRFLTYIAKLKIGNYVMTAPDVLFISGDHRTDVVGKYMREIGHDDKKKENDLDIIIEDDVWIGARAIILKGVRIGRGSVIGAGAVVNKDVPPYSVVGGVPAVILKKRFSDAEIKKHELLLIEK